MPRMSAAPKPSAKTAKPRLPSEAKAKGATGKGSKRAPTAQDKGFDVIGPDLNPRQRAFVVEYLRDKNATQAYMRAYGVDFDSANRAGPRLLVHVGVRAEIVRLEQEALRKIQQDTGITLERTLKEIARIGYFDPRRMFGPDGRPLAITELDDDTAAVVAGLDVLEEYEGQGQDRVLVGYVKKWKLADKKGALDMLMKHLGGYKEDNSQKTDPLVDLLAGLSRSALPIAKDDPQ